MKEKTLLSFAHYGEAQFFLDNSEFQFKKHSYLGYFYEGETCDLLLTGEGVISTLFRVAQILSKNAELKYSKVLNLGVVGSISKKYQPFDLVSIRTVYNLNQSQLQHHSFTNSLPTHLPQVDLITVQDRVLELKAKREVSGFGEVIDRELWATAYACYQAKTEWASIKVVSDDLSSHTDCKLIFDQKKEFSQLLSGAYQKFFVLDTGTQINKSKEALPYMPIYEKVILAPELHWTESLKSELKRLLHILGSEKKESVLKTIEDLSQNRSLNPKVRAIKLLDHLRAISNPLLFEYKTRRTSLADRWKPHGVQIQFDSKGENLDLTFKFSCQTQQGLKNKIHSLNQIIETENLDQL